MSPHPTLEVWGNDHLGAPADLWNAAAPQELPLIADELASVRFEQRGRLPRSRRPGLAGQTPRPRLARDALRARGWDGPG